MRTRNRCGRRNGYNFYIGLKVFTASSNGDLKIQLMLYLGILQATALHGASSTSST